MLRQIEALQYQLYEAGGIAHLAPGYEKVIKLGAEGIIAEVEAFEAQTTDPEKLEFYRGVKISMEALGEFGDRYAAEATRVASDERDPARRQELEKIAEVCTRVPRHGASSFYEAVQCMTLVHIAIFQETTGETTCPGRIDQFLNLYYEQDLADGVITREEAKELLGAFCVKICETIPVWSQTTGAMLGGMTSWEVITIGGQDSEGNDATNDLIATQRELAPRLWLEVSEIGAFQHFTEFHAFCDAMRPLGCRLGIEHFGRQFSEIGRLHHIGLDYLKVDGSFIRAINTQPGNQAFLKGLCSIAHNIGLTVIAEGVQTAEELATLPDLGFDGATGPAVPRN